MAKEKNPEGRATRAWSRQEAGRILDEIDLAGITDSAFARQRDLTTGRLAWWRQRLNRQRRTRSQQVPAASDSSGRQRSEFIEIKTASLGSQETRIEIRLRNGRSVLLPTGQDSVKTLGMLLDVIEGGGC